MQHERLRGEVVGALSHVLDPELGLDIVALGLVERIEIDEDGRVLVALTTTTAACPLGEQIVAEARRRIEAIGGVTSAQVELVWEREWSPERMSEAARHRLGWG